MELTYRSIRKEVQYPVFILPSGNWEEHDGLLFLDDMIVDDKNQEGKTLGARRVQTFHKNILPLKKMVTSYNGLLKQNKKFFIDNNGKAFMYNKTRYAALKYLKIRKVQQKDVATLIWLKGVHTPFTVPRPPAEGMFWAGVLHLHGLPWVLYEYSETKLKDTRKKV